MSKIRVHELAKILNINSKDLVDKLASIGVEAKNHMSSITEDNVKKVSSLFNGNTNSKQTQNSNRTEKPIKEDIKPDSKSQKHVEGTSMNTQTIDNTASKPKDESETRNIQQPDQQIEKPRQNAANTQSGRPQGDRPPYAGNRPQGDRPPYAGNRPQGDRPQNRLQGDRPPYAGNRPQGDRPPYAGNRPQGDRPPYAGNRPQGDRPPYAGNRPPYAGNRPQGDRPPYSGNRPQGDRPPYSGNRPQGDRPPYSGNRPQGDRPPYSGNRPQGDRPPYSGNRPQGDRPPYSGNRPQGDRPPYAGNRPQGDRPPYSGNRPQGDRPPYSGNRPQGGGGYSRGNTIDDKIRAFEKSKEKTTSPSVAEKPDKDHSRRLMKAPVKSDRNSVPKNSERPMDKPVFKNYVKIKREPKQINMEPRIVQIPNLLTVKQLAEVMGVAGSDVIKILIKKGEMITLNQEVDLEMATAIAENFNVMVEEEVEVDLFEENFSEEPEDESDLVERPPVVVVMGHVDHGKTSLLDSIKNSAVTMGEAGGITQHIGAYTVKVNGKPITFIDTPGHEAFTAMRMRGAQITDIAVLVVAADDGVMPQTIEAINHAKAAGVDIIVAINKIDRPSANPDRVKQELTEHGLVTEEWGGDTICVPVSAINKTGIPQLLEMIILISEMKELKANPNKKARGTIIDARLDKGRGPVATVLVQSGTLCIGDPIVAGGVYGKVRAMMDDKGERVKKAGPSKPVEILGLTEAPQAGDMFYVAENDKHARQVAEAYVAKGRVEMTKSQVQKVSLDDLFLQIQDGKVKDLNIVVKADVQGSVEAIRQSLEKLSNEEVRVRIIHGGVGAVNESDVMLASASGAIIIGFNVRPEAAAKSVADEQDVDIRLYRVIYSAIEDVQAAMKGMLDPVYEERVIGHAEIRQIFKASSVGTIGGSYITDGKFVRNAKTRITRDGKIIYDGPLETLKRFKDDVREVNAGYECGLLFSKFNDIREGDIVEAYVIEEVER